MKESRKKRIADFLEKMAVASLAIGIFQGVMLGTFMGIVCFVGSIYMTQEK